jgi:hypothetical protein
VSALQKPEDAPRLVVALATHGGRVQSHVRAFLMGPGREQFVISDTGRAQVLIADYDNEFSRAELHRFLLMERGPAIVLAMTDPGLVGTVWVPKPVEDVALLNACKLVWGRLAQREAPAPLAAATISAPAVASTRPTLRLLQGAAEPASKAVPAPVLLQPLPASRERVGPFSMAPRDDWTARIVWIALGILGIVAAVTSLGWRPAELNFRPATLRGIPVQPLAGPAQDLQQAVDLALQAMPPMPSAQRAAVEAELTDHRRLATLLPENMTLAKLSFGGALPEVSRRALPVELLPDAALPWPGQVEVRAALGAATRNASVVAKRDD